MVTYAPGIIHEDAFSENGPIVADDSSVAAFLGKTVWGPIGIPTPVLSFSQYLTLFGSYSTDSDMTYAVRGFFENGGSKAYIVRTANYTDVTINKALSGGLQSKLEINDKTTADVIFRAAAKTGGIYGNDIEVAIVDNPLVDTTLDGVTAAGAATFKVTSPQGIYVGQILEINAVEWVKVTAINTAIVAGSPEHTVSILGVTVTASHADDVAVKSLEFDLEVYYKASTAPVETWSSLSLESGTDNYILDKVNHDDEGSDYIVITDLTAVSPAGAPFNPGIDQTNTLLLAGTPSVVDSYYPAFISRTSLASGTAVGTVVAADIIGSTITGTGFESLNSLDDVRIIAVIPDSDQAAYDAAVNHAGLAYCEGRTNSFYYCSIDEDDFPSGTTTGAIVNRKADGYNSSFGAIFYNRIKVYDPEGTGAAPNRYVSPLGHVLGATARVDTATSTSGPWNMAAGARGELKGALGVEHAVGGLDIKNLNDVGINAIRQVGSLGVMIMGARTLANEQELTFRYINVRRALIHLQQSISDSLIWAAFRNNNNNLWVSIKNEMDAFLNDIWQVEGLKGETADEAYSVKVGEADGVQSANDTLNGKVIAEVAVQFQRPAETIVFRWSEKTN